MTKLEVIKVKINDLITKWEGVRPDPNPHSMDHILRTVDRMKYRNLKKEYERELNINGPLLGFSDVVTMTEEIFGVEAE